MAYKHILKKPYTSLVDSNTGENINAYVFVGVLSSSQYAYVEAFLSQNQESWISANIHMYQFFGGVTRILIPDNLKTDVEKASWDSPTLNKFYQEMAEHFGTVVIPARVRKPQDKPNADGSNYGISSPVVLSI